MLVPMIAAVALIPEKPCASRRALLAAVTQTPVALVAHATMMRPMAAIAEEAFEKVPQVQVLAWPGIEYMGAYTARLEDDFHIPDTGLPSTMLTQDHLFSAHCTAEPMIEFKQSMDALVDGAKEPAEWPFIRKRLDRFFSGGPGGIFSDRFFYLGVSAQYVFKIKYDDTAKSALVDADKLARQKPIEETMEALQQLRTELKTPEPNAVVVLGCATRARDGVGKWLSQVPAADVERVFGLLKTVRAADINRDGSLSEQELSTLDPADAEAWRARLALF